MASVQIDIDLCILKKERKHKWTKDNGEKARNHEKVGRIHPAEIDAILMAHLDDLIGHHNNHRR